MTLEERKSYIFILDFSNFTSTLQLWNLKCLQSLRFTIANCRRQFHNWSNNQYLLWSWKCLVPTIGQHTLKEVEHSTVTWDSSWLHVSVQKALMLLSFDFYLSSGSLCPKVIDIHSGYKYLLGSVKGLWDEAQYLTYSCAKLAWKWRSVQEK